MDVLRDALAFLGDPANWAGTTGIPVRLWEHLQMTFLATVIAIAIALPVGLAIGHSGRGEVAAVAIGNLGRAIPTFGVLGIVFPFTLRYLPGSIGFSATLIALILLAIPPILINSYVGVREVDADFLEAARGMGMTWRQILFQVEIPLAVPLIVAGIRNAVVAVIATATLGAVVAWGGLGRFIVDGFALGDEGQILTGAFLVATVAVLAEIAFGVAERLLAPKGAKPPRYTPGEPQSPPLVGGPSAVRGTP